MAEGFEIGAGYLDINADTDKADRKLLGFFRSADGRLRDMRGRFAKEGGAAGEEFAEEVERHADRRGGRSQLRGFLSRIGMLGGLAGRLFMNKFVGAAFLGAAATPQLISAVAGALSGLAKVGGALGALLPAGILGLVATVTALKLAFSGLGDVFKAGLSGDTAAFAEAMKKLGPFTQAAVKEVLSLKDAASALKRVVQESFFEPLVGQIKPLATLYLPKVAELLGDIANHIGGAARGISEWLRSAPVFAVMVGLFRNISLSAAFLDPILQNIVKSFLTLAQVGSDFFPGLAEGLAEVTSRFANFLAQAASSGDLTNFIINGLSLLGDLAHAFQDIWGILKAINSAAPGTASVFGIIGAALRDLNEFLNSAAGQQGLRALLLSFQTLGQILRDLLVGIGPGLAVFLEGLLEGLKALAPVAKPVGEALGTILKVLAPLLPVLGQDIAVILSALALILQTIAGELQPFIALWAQLAVQILPKLLPVIQELARNALPLIAQAAVQITEAFAPLIPVLVEIAQQLVDALLPYLPQFYDIMRDLVPVIGQVARILADAFLQVLRELGPHLPELVAAFAAFIVLMAKLTVFAAGAVPVLATLFTWLAKGAVWVMQLWEAIAQLPGAIAGAAEAFWGWLQGVGAAIGAWFVQVGQWFSDLPGRIWGFVQQLPTILARAFQQAFDAVFFAIGFGLGMVYRFFTEMVPRIWQTIMNLPTIVGNAFSAAWNAAVTATVNGWNAVMSWFGQVLPKIWSFISGIGPAVGSAFVSAWNAAKNATAAGWNAVVAWFRNLGPNIRSLLAGAGNWLYDAGRAIINGLIDGVKSAIQGAINAVKRAMNDIVSGAKRALGIASPSKVFAMEVGRWIPPGIQQGIEAKLPDVDVFMRGRMPAMAGAAAGGGGQSAAAAGTRHYTVQVGDTAFVEMVLDAVTGAPLSVAAATDEGRRRRAFSYSSRARA